MKLKPEDLNKIRERMKSVSRLREAEGKAKINVHLGTCGIASGAREILHAFLDLVERSGSDDVVVTTSGCAGLCKREPMATVEIAGQAPVKYVDLTPAKAEKIFEEHVKGGKAVKDYALAVGSERLG
ncbi:MAG: (2Fe-2S) ferredoxin domain-containing protein [Spirochaetaceae bacterium]|nr:MAG: (2Fe-2S) ferredoxin domain-containing protein [Spirochaetaceae bacterium]